MSLDHYALRWSARARRARLTIDEQGQATVVLPLRTRRRVADQLVATNARWLERHRRRILDEQAALAARPAVGAGREVLLGGVAHVIVVEPMSRQSRRSTVTTDHGPTGARLIVRLAAGDARTPADLLEGWLRRHARVAVTELVARRATEMGVTPRGLALRDQRSRWGSASRRGVLSFSWRLLLCPPSVLDYVVVHELAHLRVAGHGPRFWAVVDEHLPPPAAQVARRWLRANRLAVARALD